MVHHRPPPPPPGHPPPPPGHHPPPPPGHHPPPPPEWLINEEKTKSLAEIAERLQLIGRLLSDRGTLKLEGYEIEPSDPSWSVLRLERLPRGELSLKIEVTWTPGQQGVSPSQDIDVVIE